MTSVTGKRSVTFIELILVIGIIVILAGISIPLFRGTFSNLELDAFARELQGTMNFLRQRAIVEGRVILFNIDTDRQEYWAQIQDESARLKTYRIPAEIRLECENKEIAFYPDGDIDKVDMKITHQNNRSFILTTKGVFGGVKILSSAQ